MHLPENRIWALMARKLNNEITAAELLELDALLREHPEEHYAVEIVSEQWKQSPPKDSAALQTSFEKIWEKIQTNEWLQQQQQMPDAANPQKKINLKWWIAAATACIAVGGFWLYAIFRHPSNAQSPNIAANEITTRHGSKTKLLLPDSTQVWLNSGSKLVYKNNFGKTSREVELSGEAYFDVTHNAEKPFIIHTAKLDIKVLGTAFNVKCYPDDAKMETSLIRGSIEVTLKSSQSGKIILKPNEKLILNNIEKNNPLVTTQPAQVKQYAETLVAIEHINVIEETTHEIAETEWVQNKLVFNREKFGDLARQIERWYDVKIHFADAQLIENELTGTFENESVDEALKFLQLTTRFHYTINKNDINIFK